IPGWRHRSRGARPQTAVNSRRLRTVFESVYRGQTPKAAQRVCRITMRITDACDRSIVPPHDLVYQAHQIGVGDQRSNFRFVDEHLIELIPKRLQTDVIPSEVEGPRGESSRHRRGILRLRYASLRMTPLKNFTAARQSLIPERIKVEPVV